MLEKLADYDEHLMEELLSDIPPQRDEIFEDPGARPPAGGLIVPVLIGSALGDHGVRRLLKMLRHEVPDVSASAQGGRQPATDTILHVLKTYHTGSWRQAQPRRAILSGHVKDGAVPLSPRCAIRALAACSRSVAKHRSNSTTPVRRYRGAGPA